MLVELNKETARDTLFNRHRLQQGFFPASAHIKLLHFQDARPSPMHHRNEGLIEPLQISGFFYDDMRHGGSALYMITQHEFFRMRIQIHLIPNVVNLETLHVVLDQRERHDQWRESLMIILDYA